MRALLAVCALASAAAAITLLAGCAQTAVVGGAPVAATQVRADLTAIEQRLTDVEVLAAAYAALPACGPGVSAVCSNPKVVAEIQTADRVAFAALGAAEQALANGQSIDEALIDSAVGGLAALVPPATASPK